METRHLFDPGILREYDIRGVVGSTLRVADAFAVGRAFGSELASSGGRVVCVGYDGRLSSPSLERALVEGLRICGLEVRRVGLCPTPLLAFATQALGAAGGVMVTGSHNPADHNGFKMVRDGLCLTAGEIRAVAGRAARGDYVAAAEPGVVVLHPMTVAYAERLAADWDGERPLCVVWDPGNGAAGAVLPTLLRRLPGRHVVLNGEVDGHFPGHHPDPAEESNMRQLQDAVLAEGAALGVAFDGDGDRLGVVDDQGRIVWADQLLSILAEDVLSRHPGAPVVADVKASQVLFEEIARLGGRPVMGASGRSLIQYRMIQEAAPLGGEMSGHIFFADRYYGFDDALYAAVRLIGLVGRWPRETLAARVDRLPRRVNTPEMRMPCAEDRKFAVVADVRARLTDAGIAFDATDGVRVGGDDGWWLLRASNTQAALTARCEARSPDGLKLLRQQLLDQLRLSGLQPPWK